MKNNYKFPEGFLWGSATSAEQSENFDKNNSGGKSETIWSHSFKKMTDRFFEGKYTAGDFLNRFEEDIRIAKELNFNSLRLSMSWARLLPDGVNVNEKAVEFYTNVFNECKKHNIKVFMGLYHFDMPMWAQEKGGWLNKEISDSFAFYAKTAFELFGTLVDKWVSFNEPIVLVEGQQWYDFHYPFNVNFKDGIRAMLNIQLAHSLSLEEFRKAKLGDDVEYGIILNITPAIPRSQGKADLEAARIAELFQWRCFSEPSINGAFPNELFEIINEKGLWPEDINLSEYNEVFSKDKIDFLGINYYQPLRVKALDYIPNFDEDKSEITPHTHFYNTYEMPGRRMNVYRGWEIHPESIYTMLKTIQNEYGNISCYIAENGMGVQDEGKFRVDGVIQDTYRIDFMSEHLYWVHKAIKEGSSCFGYHMWTYIDNWSWTNAYKNRYGFVELDVDSPNRERKEKLSASWIRKVIDTNSVDW